VVADIGDDVQAKAAVRRDEVVKGQVEGLHERFEKRLLRARAQADTRTIPGA
jgi:hypothetical protein